MYLLKIVGQNKIYVYFENKYIKISAQQQLLTVTYYKKLLLILLVFILFKSEKYYCGIFFYLTKINYSTLIICFSKLLRCYNLYIPLFVRKLLFAYFSIAFATYKIYKLLVLQYRHISLFSVIKTYQLFILLRYAYILKTLKY